METWLGTKTRLILGKLLVSVSLACVLLVLSGSSAYSQSAYFNSSLSSSGGGGGGGGTVSGSINGSAGGASAVWVELNLQGPFGGEYNSKFNWYYASANVQQPYTGSANYDLVASGFADWMDGYWEDYFNWHSLQTPGPQPSISSLSPSSGQAGQTGTMTISGNSLQQAIEVFADGPISFSIIYVSNNSIQAYYTIDSGASPSSFNVYVDFPTGMPGSNALTFTVTP